MLMKKNFPENADDKNFPEMLMIKNFPENADDKNFPEIADDKNFPEMLMFWARRYSTTKWSPFSITFGELKGIGPIVAARESCEAINLLQGQTKSCNA